MPGHNLFQIFILRLNALNIRYMITGSVASIRKLEYYKEGRSEKHLRDIAGILAINSESIDFEFLNKVILEKQLEREWDEADFPALAPL